MRDCGSTFFLYIEDEIITESNEPIRARALFDKSDIMTFRVFYDGTWQNNANLEI